jgi:hypothetical protein
MFQGFVLANKLLWFAVAVTNRMAAEFQNGTLVTSEYLSTMISFLGGGG